MNVTVNLSKKQGTHKNSHIESEQMVRSCSRLDMSFSKGTWSRLHVSCGCCDTCIRCSAWPDQEKGARSDPTRGEWSQGFGISNALHWIVLLKEDLRRVNTANFQITSNGVWGPRNEQILPTWRTSKSAILPTTNSPQKVVPKTSKVPTLPRINKSHLKIDDWEAILSFLGGKRPTFKGFCC